MERFAGGISSSSSSRSLRSLPETDAEAAMLARSESLPAWLADSPDVDTEACEGGGIDEVLGKPFLRRGPSAPFDSVRALMMSRWAALMYSA